MGPPENNAEAPSREPTCPADTKFFPNITHFKQLNGLTLSQRQYHRETAEMSAAACIFASYTVCENTQIFYANAKLKTLWLSHSSRLITVNNKLINKSM